MRDNESASVFKGKELDASVFKGKELDLAAPAPESNAHLFSDDVDRIHQTVHTQYHTHEELTSLLS